MEYKQYHRKNVIANGKKIEDYYTFIISGNKDVYCGKVEKQWTTKDGKELFAVRDSDCYVTISEYSRGYLHGIGNCGYDYAIATEDIEKLICKLENIYNKNYH